MTNQPEAAISNSTTDWGRHRSDALGVALSGGGVRATLFSLGALTALVDSGENHKVKEISSVSGG